MTRKTKRRTLVLAAEESDEQQLLVAVTVLGLCRALRSRAISPEAASQYLLGPALLTRMEETSASEKLVEAVHLATELEDVKELVPGHFLGLLDEIEAKLIDVIRCVGGEPRGGYDRKWLRRSS